MMKLMLIGIGGFFGSISRYLLSGMVQRIFPAAVSFPLGTFVVNISGCLLIGLFSGLVETRQLFTPEIRVMLFIGFLGGFTTFSTFGLESFNLLRDQQYLYAFSNMMLQVVLGVPAVWLGFVMARIIAGE
jgi:CrcB protein